MQDDPYQEWLATRPRQKEIEDIRKTFAEARSRIDRINPHDEQWLAFSRYVSTKQENKILRMRGFII